MVTLRTYTDLGQAELDKSLLEAAGIPALLAGENSASAGYGGVLGELRLQVAEADADRARRVLNEHEGFTSLPDDFVPPAEPPQSGAGSEPMDTNQQILEELRKLRKTNQWTCAAALLVLVAVCVWAFLRIPPRQPSPWSDVSAAMHRYDYPTALKLTQDLVAAHPDDYYAHYYLGYIFVEMGDLTHGEAEYARAYELWPSEDMQKRLEAVRKRRQSETSRTKDLNGTLPSTPAR